MSLIMGSGAPGFTHKKVFGVVLTWILNVLIMIWGRWVKPSCVEVGMRVCAGGGGGGQVTDPRFSHVIDPSSL